MAAQSVYKRFSSVV